jgi:PAS domain S-box-containing protein
VHHQQLEIWAANCPENFENRAALVGAEIARIEGRILDAEHLYEQAIRSARANGFVHNEGLANEIAARFYAERGFDQFAELYLRNARYCYLRWGADGKVRQLDELYPNLAEKAPTAQATSTIAAPVEHLDLATVIKVSQAVSVEIVLEKLIETLMRTALEHAGAERGLLLLPRGAELQVEAEARSSGDAVIVLVGEASVAAARRPELIVNYVLRTHENVILDDASAEERFSADEYIREHRGRSILCLPLLKQAKLIGILYLENNLTPHVFTSARSAVLNVLASEAAISLENSRLYRELQEREAKIRRLVDANIVGIFIWDIEGQILEANDAFLRIVGHEREDIASGRLRWTDLTPAEWLDRDLEQFVPQLKLTGSLQPFEKEYFRKNGSRVPVLIGVAAFDEECKRGVAFVVDLTERKLAEETLRQTQAELAHVARVGTLGEMAASIAHEINQPLGAIANNAGASLRWLACNNVEEAQRSLELIRGDAHRAGEIVQRIWSFAKKAPPQKDWMDINQTIREVTALARSEMQRNGISLEMQLSDTAESRAFADRVQLQQVILNLIMNAVEAMSEVADGPRELLIRTGTDAAGGVVVAVRDTGPGLSPENLDRLFTPFYTTKPHGMGMGLAICRSIVEAHGGKLWATSNEDRGATFQFTLPSGGRGSGMIA